MLIRMIFRWQSIITQNNLATHSRKYKSTKLLHINIRIVIVKTKDGMHNQILF